MKRYLLFCALLVLIAADRETINSIGMTMVRIQPGLFEMGLGSAPLAPELIAGPNGVIFDRPSANGDYDEVPVHKVTITKAFLISTTEVTVELSALGYTISDPATAVFTGGKVVRQPFAGNIIPVSRLNPIALKYLSYLQPPDQPGKSDGENNYVVNDPTADNYKSYMGRTDLNISDNDKLFFDIHTSGYVNSHADIFQNLASGQYSGTDLWGSLIDEVHIFNPTTVLDTRLGFSRSVTDSSIKSNGFDPAQLGFPSYLLSNSTRVAMPRITFSDAFAGLSAAPDTNSAFDTLQLFSTLTKVVNRHSIKAGADLRRERYSKLSPGYSSGTFAFGTTWVTGSTGGVPPPFGGSMASLLLGLPTAGQFDINEPTTSSNYYFGFFVQDDWHLRPNLTVNLGLRAENETAVVESNNRETIGFDPAAMNQITSAARAAYQANPISQLPVAAFQPTGGLVFASPSHRSGYTTPGVFLSPRVGVSWAPGILHNKTVFRGGSGVYENPYVSVERRRCFVIWRSDRRLPRSLHHRRQL